MRSHAAALILALAGATYVAPVACGSDSSNSGGSGQGGAGGATTPGTGGGTGGGDVAPPGSCVQPGDQGNDKGVGTYCTQGGGQCNAFPEAGLCLRDVGQDQWFCTRIGCSTKADCGKDATCVHQQGSSACVPSRCLGSSTTTTTPGSGGGGGGSATTTMPPTP